MKGRRIVDITYPIMLALALLTAWCLLAVILAPVIEQAREWLLRAMGLPK